MHPRVLLCLGRSWCLNPARPLQGEELSQPRCKVLALHEVMPDMGNSKLADLILKGKNPPKMQKRTLRKLVERTIKSGGKDGRVNNKRPRSVLTPNFKQATQVRGLGTMTSLNTTAPLHALRAASNHDANHDMHTCTVLIMMSC